MNNLDLEAELLTLDFKQMYTKWGGSSPLRTGMHASAVLDKEFCAREQVLHELWPEQGEKPAVQHWDWKRSAIFENGWMLHRRIQNLHAKCGNVVWSPISERQMQDIAHHIPAAMFHLYLKLIDGQWWAAELDLTHYDPERNLYFSPDMITMFGGERYIWEIKGVNADAFNGTPRDEQGNLIKGLRNSEGKEIRPQEGLTDNLDQACAANETVAKALEQVNLYCHMLLVKKGIVYVENKSNCDFKLWVVEYDKERAWPYTSRMNEVKGRTLLVKQHGRGKLPPRCCKTIEDSRAKKCPMRALCFQEESEDW